MSCRNINELAEHLGVHPSDVEAVLRDEDYKKGKRLEDAGTSSSPRGVLQEHINKSIYIIPQTE